MNLPSPVLHEPPLSPGPAPGTSAPAPLAPVTAAPAPATREISLEAQLVRLQLVTPDQIATAMREEAESGRDLAEIVVSHGWISPEDLARVLEPPAESPEPAPAEAHAPAAVLTAVPEPAPAAKVTAELFVRLTNDERIEVGRFESQDEAETAARDLIEQLDRTGEWPQMDGRFVRPDAVVSIDVELTGL